MEIKFYGNNIIEIIDDNILIKRTDDIFSLILSNNCSTIIIKKENIGDGFYNLSTGIAGEILDLFNNIKNVLMTA